MSFLASWRRALVAALLVPSAGLLPAVPAHAQTTVWTATLTVGQSPGQNEWGCGRSGGLGVCSSSLSDDDFEFGGKTYTFTGLIVFGTLPDPATHNLFVRFSGINARQAKSALSALTLQVGTGSSARTYAFSAAGLEGLDLRWSSPPRWSKGDTVALKLTAPVAKPAKPAGFSATAGDAQVTLSWDDARNSSITKHQYQQKAGEAAWSTTWTDIPNSAPGGTNATSYTVPRLSNGTAYRFRIRAVNAGGAGPQSDIAGPATPRAGALSRVTGVKVQALAEKLAVTWNAVAGATGYKVQWKSGAQAYDTGRQRSVTATRHRITGLTAGTEYTVRVIATKTGTPDGAPSAGATGTPVTAPTGYGLSVSPASLSDADFSGNPRTKEVTLTLSGKSSSNDALQWAGSPNDGTLNRRGVFRRADSGPRHYHATARGLGYFTLSGGPDGLTITDVRTASNLGVRPAYVTLSLSGSLARASYTVTLTVNHNVLSFEDGEGFCSDIAGTGGGNSAGGSGTGNNFDPSVCPEALSTTFTLARANRAATGTPAITGTATVGETLTAAKGTVADTDGLTKADAGDAGYAYTYQWVRVDSDGSGNPTDIAGATAKTYTLAAADEGKKVKVRVGFQDDLGNAESRTSDAFPSSGTIAPESTPPTVTANKTGYYSDAAVSSPLTGALKAGADIYTKVTFSRDMKHVKSDEAAARPELFRRIASTDVQYDILNHGETLSSGDCRPNDATDTDVYVCRYTVGGSDNGTFTVKAGTNSVDKAGSALAAAYTHAATLTLDTAAPAAPRNLAAAAGTGKVRLTWSDPSPADASIAKWQVRRKTTAEYGEWADISGGAAVRAHDVTGLENGTAYTFEVRAVDTASNEGAAGTAGPATPVANRAATGKPAITGTATVGETLTAAKGTIADANGLTRAEAGDAGYAWTYQWVRVDSDGSGNPADIAGATSKTYTLAAADTGKKVRVRVGFNDDLGNAESRTSDAYPSAATIAAGDTTGPTPPANAVWSATLTADEASIFSGCANGTAYAGRTEYNLDDCSSSSVLSEDDFTYGGADYTIVSITSDAKSSSAPQLRLGFSGVALGTAKTALSALTLTVSEGGTDTAFKIAGATADAARSELYWPAATLNWDDGDKVSLWLAAAKPAKPKGLAATAGNAQVRLSWTDPRDASITKIQYLQKTGEAPWGTTWTDIPKSAPGEANAKSYAVTSLANGTAYRFRIRAVNAAGNGPESAEAGPVTPLAAISTLTPPANAVWSALLTVKNTSDYRGCNNNESTDASARCSVPAVLTDDEFDHGGTTYTIRAIEDANSGLYLQFTEHQDPWPALALTVASGMTARTFAFGDAVLPSQGNSLLWRMANLGWSVDDKVSLWLTAAKPAKPKGLVAAPGNAQVALSWTDPGDASITKYQYRQKAGAEAWGGWTDIPKSAPGQANAKSYTVTSLANGTAYRFRIRAVNAGGNGPESEEAGPVTPQASISTGAPVGQSVAANWALIPKDSSNNALVSAGGKFRLLFVTSGTTTATSTKIATYNAFVQTAAGRNTNLASFKTQFRAVISTSATNARDNTATTGTGVPIYWVQGAKVADNYADFYDGSWDSTAGKTETGARPLEPESSGPARTTTERSIRALPDIAPLSVPVHWRPDSLPCQMASLPLSCWV